MATTLPRGVQQLLDNRGSSTAEDDDARFNFRFDRRAVTRKQQRKQQRDLKKKASTQFLQQRKQLKAGKKLPITTEVNLNKPKHSKQHDPAETSIDTSSRPKHGALATAKNAQTQNLKSFSKQNPHLLQLLQQRRLVKDQVTEPSEDDRIIQEMRKKMKLKKSSKLDKVFADDGLDDVLEGLDSASEDEMDFVDSKNHDLQIADEPQKLSKQRKPLNNGHKALDKIESIEEIDDQATEEEDIENDFDDQSGDDNEDYDEMDIEEDEEALSDNVDIDAIQQEEIDDQDDNDTSGSHQMETHASESKPAAIGKYVPPQRKGTASNQDASTRLRRLVRGLINKLSESNIESILDQVVELYRQHTRHDVTSLLTESIIETCVDRSSMLETFMLVYGAFECGLYVMMGTDVGASFLQEVFDNFMDHYKRVKLDSGSVDADNGEQAISKEATNLFILLMHLYTFGMIRSQVLLDMAGLFIENLTPLDVELLVIIVKYAGFQLRSEDPAGLKALILAVQIKVQEQQQTQQKPSARVRFMLDAITAVKNNNRSKKAEAVANEALELKTAPLRKFVRNLKRKRTSSGALNVADGLHVTLSDLQSAKEKGRWWLVGAAWTGRDTDSDNLDPKGSADDLAADSHDAELMAIAKAQGMNTEVRRRVFVALTSSQDYSEAFARLMKLGLKDQQEREIVRVLVHCCRQEKVYNPFYAFVAQRLALVKYAFKVTFQFTFWDLFKELENIGTRGLSNLAHLLAQLLSSESIFVSVFKPVQFQKLSKSEASFFRLTLSLVLLPQQSKAAAQPREIIDRNHENMIAQVFKRGHQPEELREGLLFFLHHYVKPMCGAESVLDIDQRLMLKHALRMARAALKMSASDF